jgi:hypothetical protein
MENCEQVDAPSVVGWSDSPKMFELVDEALDAVAQFGGDPSWG